MNPVIDDWYGLMCFDPPRDLRDHRGDHALDTPLCYEINRLPAPNPAYNGSDWDFDQLLVRWFGEGWELR